MTSACLIHCYDVDKICPGALLHLAGTEHGNPPQSPVTTSRVTHFILKINSWN